MAYLILDCLGVVLARCDAPEDAMCTARTAYPDRCAWVVRDDGAVMAHRPGLSPRALPAVWPRPGLTRAPRGCPVVAALAHPRTLDSLVAVLPAWERAAVAKRLLWLLDHGEATFGYEDGERVWQRADPSPRVGRVGA